MGIGNLEKQKIPFDLKITRLLGEWSRHNLAQLAWELYDRQGDARRSYENRITIVFNDSSTSSVPFFEANRMLLWRKFIQLIYNPEDYWHWIPEYQCWHAISFIDKNEYTHINENYSHPIKKGVVSEREKEIFERSFLIEVAKDSQGLVEVNPNTKEHGLDGWIWLPAKMLENK